MNKTMQIVATKIGHFHSFENKMMLRTFALNKKGNELNPFSELSIFNEKTQMNNSKATRQSP